MTDENEPVATDTSRPEDEVASLIEEWKAAAARLTAVVESSVSPEVGPGFDFPRATRNDG